MSAIRSVAFGLFPRAAAPHRPNAVHGSAPWPAPEVWRGLAMVRVGVSVVRVGALVSDLTNAIFFCVVPSLQTTTITPQKTRLTWELSAEFMLGLVHLSGNTRIARNIRVFHSVKPLVPSTRIFFNMPTTRSASKTASGAVTSQPVPQSDTQSVKKPRATKRKAEATGPTVEPSQAQAEALKKRAKKSTTASEPKTVIVPPPSANGDDAPVLLPAKLTFSFEDAKNHLIAEDPRFEDVFRRLPCKPFERLERVEPFR